MRLGSPDWRKVQRRSFTERIRARSGEDSAECAADAAPHLEFELAGAIGQDTLRPFYQPIVELRTGQVRGFEALARWKHPLLGEIPPGRFNPIADDFALIWPLTEHILRQACGEAAGWPSDMFLAVNFAASQLREQDLGTFLMDVIASTNLSPARVEIEVSERSLMPDLAAAQGTLAFLRTAGMRVALDDFGTGATSLNYLKRFRFDKLKIDRAFIEDVTRNSATLAITRALIGLAVELGLIITAEGVETPDQASLLRGLGCDEAQGFLFGRAKPRAELAAYQEDCGCKMRTDSCQSAWKKGADSISL